MWVYVCVCEYMIAHSVCVSTSKIALLNVISHYQLSIPIDQDQDQHQRTRDLTITHNYYYSVLAFLPYLNPQPVKRADIV